MAVIGKIREKSTLLLVMIGGAMLLFILGDIAKSGGSVLRSGQSVVGEVGGESIDVRQFEKKVQESIDNYKNNYNVQTVDAETTTKIRNQTWDQMIKEMVLGTQRDELGLTVTGQELTDMVKGTDPDPRVRQAFSDPKTGQFNPAAVQQFFDKMEQDESGEMEQRWMAFETDLKKTKLDSKYYELIRKGMFITDAEAENDYEAANNQYDIHYVALTYLSVPDSTVEVSQSDLQDYYDKNKEKYKQEQSRDIEFDL